MTTKLDDRQSPVIAVKNSNTSGALVGTVVDARLAGRCRFVFTFGSNAGGASINASSIAIWQAATSGGTFSAIAGAYFAAASSGVISDNVAVLDTVVNPSYPWLEISGAIANSSIYISAVAERYNGNALLPPTTGAQQVVTV